MDVLNGMTRAAIARQILVALADVTGGTCDFVVCADQGEACTSVVERLGPPPRVFAVTAITLLAKTSFMRVRLLVAVVAGRRRIAELDG